MVRNIDRSFALKGMDFWNNLISSSLKRNYFYELLNYLKRRVSKDILKLFGIFRDFQRYEGDLELIGERGEG